MNWKPDFFQEGGYEFTITASDGGKIKNNQGDLVDSKDSQSFSIRVKNTNRAPSLAKIKDQTINEGEKIETFKIKDQSNLNDLMGKKSSDQKI